VPSIKLSEYPKGHDYEDLLSAIYQCCGYYTDKNICFMEEKRDISEIDLLTTNFDSENLETHLFEFKTGKNWGRKDIIALRGWMDLLNVDKGSFYVSENITDVDDEIIKNAVKKLNIDFKVIPPNVSSSHESISIISQNKKIKDDDVDIWRFSFRLERKLLDDISKLKNKNKHKDVERYKAMYKYYDKINNEIFFTDNVDRLCKMYNIYREMPNLSSKVSSEIEDGHFEKQREEISTNLFEKTYNDCNYTDIQLSTFIEHKSRLAILKSAIECSKLESEGKIDNIENCLDDKNIKLPDSLLKGINRIKKDEYYIKYPVFWQWFMWYFGGFLLTDKKYYDKEIFYLSLKTGMPEECIDNALKSLDVLFPTKKQWFYEPKYADIKLLKLFSLPYAGIGAFTRKSFYTDNNYNEFDLKKNTFEYLTKCNNLSIKVLGG